MTTTTMPPGSDLPWFRVELQKRIGNPLGDIGVLPDASHKSSGGYHCGSFDLKNIGRGIPPASGKTTDYSARSDGDPSYYKFEISHGSNLASAMDVPGPWTNGGQAAWIRWNNYILADLRTDPNRIPGLRALNFTPDGGVKRRYDTNNPGQGVIVSTDTVLWHTHLEWWRGSVMNRRAGFQRLLDLAEDAIANRPARSFSKPVAPTPTYMRGTHDMIYTAKNVPAGAKDALGQDVVNSTRCMLTEAGPIAYDYGEIIDYYNANGKETSMLPMDWSRMVAISAAMGKHNDVAAIVTGVLQGLADDPTTSVTQADVDKIAVAVRDKFAADPLK